MGHCVLLVGLQVGRWGMWGIVFWWACRWVGGALCSPGGLAGG